MFEVRFGTKIEGIGSTAWAPLDKADASEPEAFVVDALTARGRYLFLLSEGQADQPVDGAVPWYVEIFDIEKARTVLSRTTEEGDEDAGPWAGAPLAA
jgi:hypothetical protein